MKKLKLISETGTCVNVMWRLMEKRCLAETLILLRSAWIFQKKSRWWQLKHFLFSPLFGEDFQFDEHIFQMGWFNHQPGTKVTLLARSIYHGQHSLVDV